MSGNRQYKLSASNIGWDKKDDPRVIARMKELGYQGLEIAPTRLFPDTPYAPAPETFPRAAPRPKPASFSAKRQ